MSKTSLITKESGKLLKAKALLAFTCLHEQEPTDFQLISKWIESFDQDSIQEAKVIVDDAFEELSISISASQNENPYHGGVMQVTKDGCQKARLVSSALDINEVHYPKGDRADKITQIIMATQIEALNALLFDEDVPKLEICASINGDGIDHKINIIDGIFKALELKSGASSFSKVCNKFGIRDVDFTITFSNDGVHKIGYKIANPSRALVLFFLALNKKISDEFLANFEAIMEVEKPEFIAFTMHPDRWKTIFGYDILP